jgi:tetratricopeptide (TPR) repeat protein
LRDKQSALEDYNKAIQLQPNYARAYNNRGLIRFDLGDKKAAIEDYNRAIQFQPDLFQPYNNRGLAHYALGDKQAAIADYNKAIELKPDDAIAYNNRGKVQSDKKLAIADYTKAIQLDPDFIDAYFNRGLTYEADNLRSAINDYTSIIERKPDFVLAYVYRGNAHFRLRHQKESIADSDKAINIYNNQWVSSFGTGTKQGSAANNNKTTNLISEAYNIRGAAISELIGNKDAGLFHSK